MIKIVPVSENKKEILRNLLEKYDYEFSQYNKREVNDLGLFGYKYLDHYWTEERRWAYFIYVDDKLAGFAMINDFPEAKEETDYTMAEFFVLYKYRRMGIGKFAAHSLFDKFKGKWQLKRHPHNLDSVYFWDKVIAEYTNGNFRLKKSYPDSEYTDGTRGDIYFFET
jgi:predicted acetyltransferase